MTIPQTTYLNIKLDLDIDHTPDNLPEHEFDQKIHFNLDLDTDLVHDHVLVLEYSHKSVLDLDFAPDLDPDLELKPLLITPNNAIFMLPP